MAVKRNVGLTERMRPWSHSERFNYTEKEYSCLPMEQQDLQLGRPGFDPWVGKIP